MLNKFAAFSLAALTLATLAHACGEERWPVKTLADKSGRAISRLRPEPATIRQLTSIAGHERKELLHAESTRFPEEKHVYKVAALIIGYKVEGDSDFHIVLADPTNPQITMIAEIPAGSCAPKDLAKTFDGLQQAFSGMLSKPTAKFKKLAKPIPATFVGVGFFDFLHGQTGVAPNGFELHPVIGFELPPIYNYSTGESVVFKGK